MLRYFLNVMVRVSLVLRKIEKICSLQYNCTNKIYVSLQGRIMKVVAFILSLQPDVSLPFLIISTSAALCDWDDVFFCVARTMNTVVYNGNKDLRARIRKLEFYEGTGGILFQVLITTPEVALEVAL